MDVEKLKIISEGMGYETRMWPEGHPEKELQIKKEGLNGYVYYNWYRPHTTNNDQMVEILKKLISAGGLLDGCHAEDEDSFMIYFDEPMRFYTAKTINEAVCNAAFEYFSGIKK